MDREQIKIASTLVNKIDHMEDMLSMVSNAKDIVIEIKDADGMRNVYSVHDLSIIQDLKKSIEKSINKMNKELEEYIQCCK